MAASFLKPYQPSFLILFVTARCNARCPFCFYAQRINRSGIEEPEELSLEEFRAISRKCGRIPYLLISGGEPILRKDLVDVVSCFVENAGVEYVTIPSNGLSPGATVDVFRKLTERYPRVHFRAAFSVDYPDERHDNSRGIDGCLDSLLKAAGGINELKKNRENLSLDVVTVFLPDNSDLHHDLRKWVGEKIGPDNHELHLLREEWPHPLPEGIDLDEFLEEAENYMRFGRRSETRNLSSFFRGLNDVYISILSKLVRGQRVSKCFAGRKITVINEMGDVRLCEFRPEVLGNLRTEGYDLRRILRGSRDLFRKVNEQKCTCTWECAVSTNIVSSVRFYPRLLVSILHELLKWRRR